MCERPILPQISQITQRNAAGLHYFADKRQLARMYLLKQMPQIIAEKDSYHIVECCSCLYNKSVREHACSFLVLSLPFPYSFLALSLLFPCSFVSCSFFVRSLFVPYVFNGRSPADLADLRRQTTKPQKSLYLKQTVFLCDIMQPAAFLSA